MIRKIAAFQRLLMNSLSFQSSRMKNFLPMWIVFLAVSASNVLLAPIVGNFGGLLIFSVLSLFFVYQILNGSLKPYEFVPVSMDFVIGNLFLFAVFLTFFYLLVVSTVGFGAMFLFFFATAVFGKSVNLFATFTASSPLSLNAFLFVLFITLIVLFLGTALSCIKKRAWRVSSLTVFIVLCFVLLLTIKKRFPVSENDSCAFTVSAYAGQIHGIVALTGALCLLIVPLALLLGRHFYRGRMNPCSSAERQE